MKTILYTDFNCPFCYATEHRLATLGLDGEIEWRGVEHAPHLPVPMAATPGLMMELRRELSAIKRLEPNLPIALPAGKPNTHRATLALAAVAGIYPGRAAAFRHNVYRALWLDGLDLSDPGVLRQLALATGLPGVPASLEPYEVQLKHWRREWQSMTGGAVPALVNSEGASLVGLGPVTTLSKFIRESARDTSARAR